MHRLSRASTGAAEPRFELRDFHAMFYLGRCGAHSDRIDPLRIIKTLLTIQNQAFGLRITDSVTLPLLEPSEIGIRYALQVSTQRPCAIPGPKF